MTLKEIRSKLRVTQEELAVMLDVSIGSIRKWETFATPSYTSMHKIQSLCKKKGIKFEPQDLVHKKED